MNQQEHSQSIWALMMGLVVIMMFIVAGIRTLDRFTPNGAHSVQLTGLPTPGEGNPTTPYLPVTQTMTFRMTQKAVLIATIASITRTPYDTPVPPSTGTRENERIKPSGEKLGLDALNGWFGIVDGNNVSIYAGSLLTDPEQGAIAILITFPYRNFSEKVLTPTKHGGVRVVSEQNNRLTLLAVDDEIFYFDVPARQYVASPTEVVPPATPPPTYTPYAPAQGTPMPTYNPYPMPTEPATEAP